MKTTVHALLILMCAFVLGSCASFNRSDSGGSSGKVFQTGTASWYGKRFQGRKTASGERFNMQEFTAAHRTLPFGSKVLVKSLTTGRSVLVRINDRGPFHSNRVLDMSYAAAAKLDIISKGEDRVEIRVENN